MTNGVHTRRPGAVLLIAVLAASALCGPRQLMDWDLYWHLAVGREVLRQRSPLPTDIFSHTAHGAPWAYKDLIADVLLYAGHRALGDLWFALLKGGAALGIAAALFLMPGRR